MREYRYFISFNVNAGDKKGFGNWEIDRYRPIQKMDDIIEIGELLEKELNLPQGSVCILSFQLFN